MLKLTGDNEGHVQVLKAVERTSDARFNLHSLLTTRTVFWGEAATAFKAHFALKPNCHSG